jgi:hypothetical protein
MSRKRRANEVSHNSDDEDAIDPLEFEALEEYQEDMERVKRAAIKIKGDIINNKVRCFITIARS